MNSLAQRRVWPLVRIKRCKEEVTVAIGYDGSSGWSMNMTETGLRHLEGAQLAMMRRESDFYRAVRLDQLYQRLTVSGKDKQTAVMSMLSTRFRRAGILRSCISMPRPGCYLAGMWFMERRRCSTTTKIIEK